MINLLAQMKILDYIKNEVERSDSDMCFIDSVDDIEPSGLDQNDLDMLERVLEKGTLTSKILNSVITMDDNDALVCGFTFAPGGIYLARLLEEKPLNTVVNEGRALELTNKIETNSPSDLGETLYIAESLHVKKDGDMLMMQTQPELCVETPYEGDDIAEAWIEMMLSLPSRPQTYNTISWMFFYDEDEDYLSNIIDYIKENRKLVHTMLTIYNICK